MRAIKIIQWMILVGDEMKRLPYKNMLIPGRKLALTNAIKTNRPVGDLFFGRDDVALPL
jgi:hypothetical protein